MQNVDDYRQQILQCIEAAVTSKGEPRYTSEDGMDFNTPEEIAQLLMESGL